MTHAPPSMIARLAAVGHELHGADWQRATARELGTYHPGGARDGIDYRLVRRWVSGQRPVPGWVESAIPKMIADGIARHQRSISALRDVAARYGYAPHETSAATDQVSRG